MPEETTSPSVSRATTTPEQPTTAPTPAAPTPEQPTTTPTPPAPTQSQPTPVPAPVPAPAAVGKPGLPGGRPDPRPVPPAHRPEVAPAEAVVAPVVTPVDPSEWGRIDDAGTVYVRTADGERVVGEWQAGDAAAGLAHFGRRFDDFSTEIALLEARLASGAGDAKGTRSQAAQLKESLATLAAVGDLDGAAARLDAVTALADAAIEEVAAARAAARAQAVAAKEALCVEAERLSESTQWKTAGDRLKSIVDEWRTIRGIDRKTDDALWKRFSRARDTFTRARGSHFAEMDKQRLAAREVKEKLIKRAEALSGSRDWRETASAYRDLMAEWKAAGRAPRDIEDELWQRFRAAQDSFFDRRNEVFSQRDAEFEANAKSKEKLLAEAEQIDPAADLDEAKRRLRQIQDRWEAAGKVPRERMRELDGRLKQVEDKVRTASEAQWRRTDPEATARVEQFEARVAQFREQADKARAAGDARKAAEAQKQAETWEQWLRTARSAVEG